MNLGNETVFAARRWDYPCANRLFSEHPAVHGVPPEAETWTVGAVWLTMVRGGVASRLVQDVLVSVQNRINFGTLKMSRPYFGT